MMKFVLFANLLLAAFATTLASDYYGGYPGMMRGFGGMFGGYPMMSMYGGFSPFGYGALGYGGMYTGMGGLYGGGLYGLGYGMSGFGFGRGSSCAFDGSCWTYATAISLLPPVVKPPSWINL